MSSTKHHPAKGKNVNGAYGIVLATGHCCVVYNRVFRVFLCVCLLVWVKESTQSLQIWMESYFVYAYEILFYCPSGETLKGIVHPKNYSGRPSLPCVILNMHGVLSYAEHKIRYFEECLDFIDLHCIDVYRRSQTLEAEDRLHWGRDDVPVNSASERIVCTDTATRSQLTPQEGCKL